MDKQATAKRSALKKLLDSYHDLMMNAPKGLKKIGKGVAAAVEPPGLAMAQKVASPMAQGLQKVPQMVGAGMNTMRRVGQDAGSMFGLSKPSPEMMSNKFDMYRDIVQKTRGYDNAPSFDNNGQTEAGKMRYMRDMIRNSARTGDFTVPNSVIGRQ